MSDKATEWHGWAIERPGYGLFVECDCDEARAWHIALGWPSMEEINAAKAAGSRAFAVRITEVKTP